MLWQVLRKLHILAVSKPGSHNGVNSSDKQKSLPRGTMQKPMNSVPAINIYDTSKALSQEFSGGGLHKETTPPIKMYRNHCFRRQLLPCHQLSSWLCCCKAAPDGTATQPGCCKCAK